MIFVFIASFVIFSTSAKPLMQKPGGLIWSKSNLNGHKNHFKLYLEFASSQPINAKWNKMLKVQAHGSPMTWSAPISHFSNLKQSFEKRKVNNEEYTGNLMLDYYKEKDNDDLVLDLSLSSEDGSLTYDHSFKKMLDTDYNTPWQSWHKSIEMSQISSVLPSVVEFQLGDDIQGNFNVRLPVKEKHKDDDIVIECYFTSPPTESPPFYDENTLYYSFSNPDKPKHVDMILEKTQMKDFLDIEIQLKITSASQKDKGSYACAVHDYTAGINIMNHMQALLFGEDLTPSGFHNIHTDVCFNEKDLIYYPALGDEEKIALLHKPNCVSCHINASPTIQRYSIMHNGKPVTLNYDDVTYIKTNNAVNIQIYYHIDEFKEKDEGTYTCEAQLEDQKISATIIMHL